MRRVQELEAGVQAELDSMDSDIRDVFDEARATLEARERGKQKGGWSPTYGKILTQVQDLI